MILHRIQRFPVIRAEFARITFINTQGYREVRKRFVKRPV